MSTHLSPIRVSSKASMLSNFSTDELVWIAREGFAFQSIKVMEAIVEAEQSRIQQERMAWRIGGMIVGGLLGIGDGFDASDLLSGLAVGSLATLGHEVASHEQLEFLKKCKADWLVTASSPVDLARRLGAPRYRVVMTDSSWSGAQLLSLHQGSRGDYLIPLDCACRCARGFTDTDSHQALVNTFDSENYEIISNQLYPIESMAVRLDSVRKLNRSETSALSHSSHDWTGSEPVMVEIQGKAHNARRFPVPVHSDF